MEITLEKIELVKDRTGVSYAEAKAALEKAGGSVVDAIIMICLLYTSISSIMCRKMKFRWCFGRISAMAISRLSSAKEPALRSGYSTPAIICPRRILTMAKMCIRDSLGTHLLGKQRSSALTKICSSSLVRKRQVSTWKS